MSDRHMYAMAVAQFVFALVLAAWAGFAGGWAIGTQACGMCLLASSSYRQAEGRRDQTAWRLTVWGALVITIGWTWATYNVIGYIVG